MKLLIALIMFLFFSACSVGKIKKTQKEKSDSISYVANLRKDTVRIVEVKTITDSVQNYIEVDCDSTNYKQHFDNKKSRLAIEKSSGKVKIKYTQNPLNEFYKMQYEKQLEKSDSLQLVLKNTQDIQTEIIVQYKIPKWIWWLLIISNLFWLLFRDSALKIIKL